MPNIKPVSDLRNYTAVLDSVAVGAPVYLTKNGRGCFTLMDMEEQELQEKKANEYDRMAAQLKLMCQLNAGRTSGEEQGWVPAEKVRGMFQRKMNEE